MTELDRQVRGAGGRAPKWLVGIGASAGGFLPLRTIVAGLDPMIPAAVLVVMHLRSARPSTLANQLARASRLRVETAADGTTLVAGTVYVCPPDRHLAVDHGRLRVLLGPAENGHRPSIDVLFRSLGLEADGRSLAVVVSGALDDGAAGALAVVDSGGTVIVQDPDEAVVASMPEHVLAVAPGTTCLPAAEIARWIGNHVRRADRSRAVATADLTGEPNGDGGPSSRGFACPDCGGTLVAADEERLMWFECRVGHRWSAGALRERQDGALEDALWAALRIVDEQLDLDRRLLDRARAAGHDAVADRLVRRVRDRADAAARLREVLETTVRPQAASVADELDGDDRDGDDHDGDDRDGDDRDGDGLDGDGLDGDGLDGDGAAVGDRRPS